MARTGKPAVRHVAAVERAVGVLEVLADEGGELGTNELARRTGVNASSVSRILATLSAGGYIWRPGRRRPSPSLASATR